MAARKISGISNSLEAKRMYCSSCGVAVATGLSYCNFCGAKLNEKGDNAGKSSDLRPGFLISAMIGLFVLGLFVITILMGMMKSILAVPTDRVLGFAMVPFLVLLLLEGLCFWLLMGRLRGTRETRTAQLKEPVTKELDTPPERRLQEPMSSVTEYTTRTLDPVYRVRESK